MTFNCQDCIDLIFNDDTKSEEDKILELENLIEQINILKLEKAES